MSAYKGAREMHTHTRRFPPNRSPPIYPREGKREQYTHTTAVSHERIQEGLLFLKIDYATDPDDLTVGAPGREPAVFSDEA